ncbi:PIN domain-containing protein [Lunatibacter salilacus]|uniref:PIN domain-containing protein n=1 Tax=Lunatibacter salilacus TaxID=2483804 RepID=UPI00131CCA4D|nr:PIN domain-containing protein [Lunatibacter salilacus]
MVTRQDQINFYADELKELEFSVKRIFNSTGLSLFQNGELYVGQYKGFDSKRGNAFFDLPFGDKYHSPRIDENLTCFTLKNGFERPETWKDINFLDLLKDRNRTEAKTVDYIPSKREGWITLLVRGMEYEFVKSIQINQILGFGPTIPPFEYLQNLKLLSESFDENSSTLWEKILGFKFKLDKNKAPGLLKEDHDIAGAIISELDKSNIYIFQGPPGTGKTHLVAEVVSRLAKGDKSVLITALTNKATVEVCKKDSIAELLKSSKISKLPLSIDEKKLYPELGQAKELVAIKGHVLLTTYYQFSRIWKTQTNSFDYVIVEEASQAYLTTIAAATKVGKKVIVVGDPKQILPIVSNKNYEEYENIDFLVNGMNSVAQMESFIFNRKIETRRLTERSTIFTNNFYQNTIQSISLNKDLNQDIEKLNSIGSLMHPLGGPSLILFSDKFGSIKESMLKFLVKGIDELSQLKKNEIAVLTPYIETLIYLQQNLKSKTNSKNYLIETVDRVQGLDVDYCFYVIPKSSSFSFNLNRFNVATSRAKKSTYILTDDGFNQKVNLNNNVDSYLRKLNEEFSFKFTSNGELIKNKNESVNEITNPKIEIEQDNQIENSEKSTQTESKLPGLKILGHIDLSKPGKHISIDKKNYYLIDTNVFVDDPEIISKIDKKYPIILSAKVLDELDSLKLKLDSEGKKMVQRALKSINQNQNSREIRLVTSDISLLPDDFDKRSPDNRILTVLLKLKNDNPILISSDNGLQIKAKGLGLKTITLKEFIRQTK